MILSFRNLSDEIFRHTFLRNYEAWKIETLYTHGQWADVSCILESGCSCLFIPLFFHFSFSPIFKHWNFSSHFSKELWGVEDWNMLHMWTMDRCILSTKIRLLLLIHPFISSFFFLSNFQTLKFLVTLFSGTVRPRRSKLGTHLDSWQMYCVYWNQAAAAYSSLYFSFFFLSNFPTWKFFVTLFSGTVRPRRLKVVTHMENGWLYRVYRNHAADLICLFISFFFLSNFQMLKIFITLFSGTVRPRRLKLGTYMESRQMYHVYQNQAAAIYSSLYFFFFLSLQFSDIEIFCHTFLRKCEA